MNKFLNFVTKIGKIKHLPLYIAIVLALLVCSFYFFNSENKSDTKNNISTENSSSTMEYVTYLENKLGNVLSKISGVGSVNVIITLESGFSYEYATDTETKSVASGGTETTITTETVILVSNKPVVMKEIYPTIKGVVVVAKGAENFSVKMNILSAVETVLEIDRTSITILA